jgi:PHP family Zn ribbon phosphoesterase
MIADFHIHTLLSPCASLDMSPDRIIAMARMKGLNMIGITDHNTTRQCKTVWEIGKDYEIHVLPGAEVTTREEVHCLVFMKNFEMLDQFQLFLDNCLPDIKNDPAKFGYQVVVDRNNIIIYEEEKFLSGALSVSLDQLIEAVHRLNGLAIPAHIDRIRFGLTGQLGFIPDGLQADAMEISFPGNLSRFRQKYPSISQYSLITGSDAHDPDQIGLRFSYFDTDQADFPTIATFLSLKQIFL